MDSGGKFHVPFGQLYLSELLRSRQAWQCPSYVGSDPIWPPGEDANLNVRTRSNFGIRPGSPGSGSFKDWEWNLSSGPKSAYIRLPRYTGRMSLLADQFTTPSTVDARHRDGVNVADLDGSVGWIDRADFTEQLDALTGYSPAYNQTYQALWDHLDGL
jgi:hypothetical protein